MHSLGSEVETSEKEETENVEVRIIYAFPIFKRHKRVLKWIKPSFKNITLSTQRTDLSGYELIDIVENTMEF